MSDKWLQSYESCSSYIQEINQKLNEFQKLSSGSPQRAKVSSTIRTMLAELNKDLEKLSSDLSTQSRNGVITQKEANRRRTLVDELKRTQEKLESTKRDSDNASGAKSRINPRFAPVAENETTQNWTNNELVGIRSDLRKNNDDAIEALHAIVKRQKDIGSQMNDEVDRHNEIIDNMTDQTSLLDNRVKRQTLLVNTVNRKTSACCLWVIIIIIFVAIVVIAAVPFKDL